MDLRKLDHWHNEHEPLLEAALRGFKNLHERTLDGPYAIRSTEHIVSCLGKESRENLAAYMELLELKSSVPLSQKFLQEERRRRALAVLYHHYGYSQPGYPIKTMQMGQLQTQQFLEGCMYENAEASCLRKFGLVMIDVNGMKAVKECIGHDQTNEFLRELSKAFANKESTSRGHLEKELGTEMTPLVAGGDEFAIVLHGSRPLDQGILQTSIELFEEEMAQHPTLRQAVDFENVHVWMNRAGWAEEKKKEFLHNRNPEDAIHLQDIRQYFLPSEFKPSISGGGVTLAEGIAWALNQHDEMKLDFETEENFLKACNKIFRGMFLIAEQRQHERKLRTKENLLATDRRQGLFLTRTKEAQQLEMDRQHTRDRITQHAPDARLAADKLQDTDPELAQRLRESTSNLELQCIENDIISSRNEIADVLNQ